MPGRAGRHDCGAVGRIILNLRWQRSDELQPFGFRFDDDRCVAESGFRALAFADVTTSSSKSVGAIAASAASPSPRRLRIAGAVAKSTFTSLPVSRRNASTTFTSPGSTARALSNFIILDTIPPEFLTARSCWVE